MIVSKYFVLFIFYSFLGWVYESIYCTIHEHSWQNRGFLYGPCVPMYGIGATLAQIIFNDLPIPALHSDSDWIIFAACAAGTFIMEYVTSFILEKLFHARWWDYSDLPLNINGRVCLIFTACFGIAGVLIVRYLIPPIAGCANSIPPLALEVLSLVLMLMLGMDLALTVSALTTFLSAFEQVNEIINNQIAEKYAALENTVFDARVASIEKHQATKEAAFVKKELTAEKLNELKEQLQQEYVHKALSNASAAQKGQLRHIAKFTHPVASTKQLLEKGSSILKAKKSN